MVLRLEICVAIAFVGHSSWFDSYALLLCDYICSVLPSMSPSLSSTCKDGVSSLTNYLLSRLVQVTGDNAQCEKLAAGIIALAGREPLTPEARAEHQKIVADTTLAPPHVSGEQVVEEVATGLPQTDLTAGLLECLSSPADTNLHPLHMM